MLSIWQTTFCPTCSQWIVGFWQLNEAKFEERVKVTKIFHRSFGKVKFWGWVVSQNVSQIWTCIWFDVCNALVQACQILWCFQSRIRMTFLVLNSGTGGNFGSQLQIWTCHYGESFLWAFYLGLSFQNLKFPNLRGFTWDTYVVEMIQALP
jgi:hypothetical protein